ncbi:MAG: DNA polymerase III subunit chi [Pseudomonadota bacterium]|nr:DNA polymerase III subunit chi [Pseudomonadota bacterium]
MPEVWFYHLERTGPEQVLPELLEKTLARGWRAVVRAPDPERLAQLDRHLWVYRDDSFLPHAVAGEADDGRQPILLTADLGNPNGAQALFLIDGAEPGPLDGWDRCVILLDGRDQQAVAGARDRWRSLKQSGVGVSYWKQTEAGGWSKQG